MDSYFALCAAAIGFFTILGSLLFMVLKKIRSYPENKTISSSSSSSSSAPPSSSSSSRWKYDIFSSFSAVDVPKSFLNRIWKELRRKGFDPSIDNEMVRCVSIGPDLNTAIRGSRIVIVILSRNYASSPWCLNELAEIMMCREEVGQRVATIFYELEPIDVEKQTGDFGKIFRKTCKGKTKEDIESWRQALAEVATIDGYHSSHWDNEAAMIEKIGTDISNKLNNTTQTTSFEGLVAMEAHVEKMEQMLCLDSDEVRMIGIWGPPGIGKTTIARFLFNRHSHQFQLSVFMGNIKTRERIWHEEYNAKLQLQNQFLSQLLNQNYTDEILNLGAAKKKLKDKKAFVVFDDVDSLRQLDALAIEALGFGLGSRIIITTQEPRLLKALGIKHIYKVEFPSPDEAFQIFCLHLFGQKSPYDRYAYLAREVATLSGKYPLGLRFMGSYFRGRYLERWKYEIPRLLTILDGEIGSIVKLTYDSLWDEDKELSHHLISSLRDGELTERMEEYLANGFSEVRQERTIIKQDLKVDLYRSEGAFGGISNGLLHSIDIYCADTLQYSFASHLSMDFRRKGIYAFVSSSETLDVIEGASASVVVFSNSCFSSTAYLDNLVRVLQCQRTAGQLVVPVYYGISPSDVVLQEHESSDRIREWSSALQELRELPGYQFREEWSECELVEEITKDIYEKLFPTEQIGINLRRLEIEQLLCKQPWGIRRIGIWGMPGIGKTTLAEAVFNQLSGGYEASCLIKHFDKAFHEKGLHQLLEEHFGKILKELPRVCSSITRPSLPGDKLSKKKTLVVLDDVDNALVAESFLGRLHWFGPGSLIIITSRDKKVFRLCQIKHVYEVQSLNENEALQLFSQCAFGEDISEQKLLELSMEVVDYASGNPLALKFYGKELKGKRLSEMETTFFKLKLRTPYKIHDLFMSSYETLSDIEKNIFLDIACFFTEENVDYMMRLLEGCGFFPHVGIDVLVGKCLVTILGNRVKMHRIIQDFGREIINGETVRIERRRRLWEPWTIKYLIEDDELKATYTRALGTEDIEGIFLDTSKLIFDVKPGAFENMLSLRFLKIYCSSNENHYGLRLPKGLESLPYELRLLHWENYPLQSLPQDFDPCHLVELDMSYSQLQKLWGGTKGTKNLKMLKIARLCHSQQLTEIDDIREAQNIELIDLQSCTKLQSFPATSHLQHLRVVNLSGCTEIRSFPEVSPNTEELHLQGTGIRELPISIVTFSQQDKLNRGLSNLLTEFSGVSNALNFEKLTSVVQVDSSNQHLGKLGVLNMKDCSHLESLPHMVDLESLEVLNLSGCSQLKDIQGLPRNIKELYLVGTAIEELPLLPWSVVYLNAHGCVSLIAIPLGFERLPKYYTFSNCFALSQQVVSKFVKNALTNVERIVREYQQELKKSLAFRLCMPSPANEKSTLDLQPGSSVMIRLGSSWRSTLLGFVLLVEVAFSEDYHMDTDFGVRYVCRWKDKEGFSHRLVTTSYCWSPEEDVPNIQKNHLFVLCNLDLHPSSGEGKDSDILAGLVVFEFFPVNGQEKLLDGSCTVKKCGVYVITAENGDTSVNMTPQVSSSDHTNELSNNEAEEELLDIYDALDKKDKNLFNYILCLLNEEETDVLGLHIASIDQEISSRLEVLANRSLISISPYGVIVPPHLQRKLDREIVRGSALPSTLPDSLTNLDLEYRKTSMASSFSNRKRLIEELLTEVHASPRRKTFVSLPSRKHTIGLKNAQPLKDPRTRH